MTPISVAPLPTTSRSAISHEAARPQVARCQSLCRRLNGAELGVTLAKNISKQPPYMHSPLRLAPSAFVANVQLCRVPSSLGRHAAVQRLLPDALTVRPLLEAVRAGRLDHLLLRLQGLVRQKRPPGTARDSGAPPETGDGRADRCGANARRRSTAQSQTHAFDAVPRCGSLRAESSARAGPARNLAAARAAYVPGLCVTTAPPDLLIGSLPPVQRARGSCRWLIAGSCSGADVSMVKRLGRHPCNHARCGVMRRTNVKTPQGGPEIFLINLMRERSPPVRTTKTAPGRRLRRSDSHGCSPPPGPRLRLDARSGSHNPIRLRTAGRAAALHPGSSSGTLHCRRGVRVVSRWMSPGWRVRCGARLTCRFRRCSPTGGRSCPRKRAAKTATTRRSCRGRKPAAKPGARLRSWPRHGNGKQVDLAR